MNRISRRDALKLTAGVLALPSCGSQALPETGRAAEASADAPRLWYREPATEWVEALPVGNGRLGAMIFGGIEDERLQLNEDTLWGGGPYDPANPRARAALPKIRQLLAEQRFEEAQALVQSDFMADPIRQMPYQTVGNLRLGFIDLEAGQAEDYRRELDLDAAVARTRFRIGNTTYTRELIASAVDQVLMLRLSADQPGALSFDLSFDSPMDASSQTEGETELILDGVNSARHGNAAALRYRAACRVRCEGGACRSVDGGLQIRKADRVTLRIAIATSYRRYDDVSGSPEAIVKAQLDAAARKDDERLIADHQTDFRELFRRVSIDLGRTELADLPTRDRVGHSHRDVGDPALAALYFQYGRYLLISCSRPGTQPANLQGIWNDQLDPPWSSKYTININTEMNYWPAEPTHLEECVEPLVAMLEDLAQTGARTAQTMYGARGWVTHHNTDLWRATAPIDSAYYGTWPCGGAWLCLHLWDHYDYGRDRAFLERAYPIMQGAALFFVDALIEDPEHGWLMTSPSMSPENEHPYGTTLCAGPTMDMQIIRDLFGNVIESARILGVDNDLREQLADLRSRLVPNQIGEAGQLQEWRHDWDLEAPHLQHRHVSHLYGLFPSSQINIRDTPELAAAARRSLKIRGDESTGWGTGWRINLWARLGDGNHAHEVLEVLLGKQRTYPNLFDAHPPFQIDGNFGGTSGICEMLLQSWGGSVHLLPALPDAWPQGTVRGLRARGGCGVDLEWAEGGLVEAVVRSTVGGRYRFEYRNQGLDLKLAAGGKTRLRLIEGELREV